MNEKNHRDTTSNDIDHNHVFLLLQEQRHKDCIPCYLFVHVSIFTRQLLYSDL